MESERGKKRERRETWIKRKTGYSGREKERDELRGRE